MPVIFRDSKTNEIIRIDCGDPDPKAYAEKEGLQNWIAETVEMKEIELYLTPSQINPEMDLIARFRQAKTIEGKVQIIAKKIGLI